MPYSYTVMQYSAELEIVTITELKKEIQGIRLMLFGRKMVMANPNINAFLKGR